MTFSDYRVTPLLIFSAIVLGAIITGIVAPFPQFGKKETLYLIPIIPLSQVLDYFFQKYVKSNAVLWISECILILMALITTSQLLYG